MFSRTLLLVVGGFTASSLIAGCTTGAPNPVGFPLQASPSTIESLGSGVTGNAVLTSLVRGDAANQGVYVSEFDGTAILGYKSSRQTKSAPLCQIKNVSSVSGIAVDAHGNFIEPDGGTQTISVYRGPQMCGDLVSFMKDPCGYPTDAASADAVNGTIVVANSFDVGNSSGEGPGSISVCKLGPGCTRNLTNSNMYQVTAVAFDNSGDCFASAGTASGKPRLVYFKGCNGKGTVATGYQNVSPGGLDFDKSGNLVSLDTNYNTTGRLFVYRGCKPKCVLVGGPFYPPWERRVRTPQRR